MHRLLEFIKIDEISKATLKQIRTMNENSPVNGYVTITKNKGKKNEVIVQEDIKNLLTTSGRDFFHNHILYVDHTHVHFSHSVYPIV